MTGPLQIRVRASWFEQYDRARDHLQPTLLPERTSRMKSESSNAVVFGIHIALLDGHHDEGELVSIWMSWELKDRPSSPIEALRGKARQSRSQCALLHTCGSHTFTLSSWNSSRSRSPCSLKVVPACQQTRTCPMSAWSERESTRLGLWEAGLRLQTRRWVTRARGRQPAASRGAVGPRHVALHP